MTTSTTWRVVLAIVGISIILASVYQSAQNHDRRTENDLRLCAGAFQNIHFVFPHDAMSARLIDGTHNVRGQEVEQKLKSFGVENCPEHLGYSGPCCPFPMPNNTKMTLSVWRNGEDRIFGVPRESAGYLLTLTAPSVIPATASIYAQATRDDAVSSRTPKWISGPVGIGDGDIEVRDLFWTSREVPNNPNRWEIQYTLVLQNTGSQDLTKRFGVRFLDDEGELLQTEVLDPIKIAAGENVVTTETIQVSTERGLDINLGHAEAKIMTSMD